MIYYKLILANFEPDVVDLRAVWLWVKNKIGADRGSVP